LMLILLGVGLCSALHAVAKPFWYDEIITTIVCHLPTVPAIWHALDSAADTNPPFFYVVFRLAGRLISDDHLGYRLPSILGLLGTVLCIYIALARRLSRLSALVAATSVLCTPLASYAFEARPYALMLGCISGAVVAWQRIDDSMLWALVVAIALAMAESLHYYAILVWPAFVVAELSVCIVRRRFRVRAWAAFLVGALPLLLFARLLLNLRAYYGEHYWAQPSIRQVFDAFDWLFNMPPHWGWLFAVGVTAALLWPIIVHAKKGGLPSLRHTEVSVVPIEELALALMLVWLPVVGVAVAMIGHGGMTARYLFPTVIGGGLAVGYLVERLATGRVLLIVLLLSSYASSSVGVVGSLFAGSLLKQREEATREFSAILSRYHAYDNLPVVISDSDDYLRMAYYTPADLQGRLYTIVDPAAAVAITGTDSEDLAFIVLRRYFPLQAEEYGDFLAKHGEFLLASGGSMVTQLVRDGNLVTLVSTGSPEFYRVTVKR
jgi:hypothetical protein